MDLEAGGKSGGHVMDEWRVAEDQGQNKQCRDMNRVGMVGLRG